jgi:hypothetical protein
MGNSTDIQPHQQANGFTKFMSSGLGKAFGIWVPLLFIVLIVSEVTMYANIANILTPNVNQIEFRPFLFNSLIYGFLSLTFGCCFVFVLYSLTKAKQRAKHPPMIIGIAAAVTALVLCCSLGFATLYLSTNRLSISSAGIYNQTLWSSTYISWRDVSYVEGNFVPNPDEFSSMRSRYSWIDITTKDGKIHEISLRWIPYAVEIENRIKGFVDVVKDY